MFQGPTSPADRGPSPISRCSPLVPQRVSRLAFRNEHPVDGREVTPGISEHFGIGGVIRVLHGHDAAAQRSMFRAQKVRQFLLGLRGSDDQYFVRAGERMRDFVEELMIGRRFVAAMRALAAMHPGLAMRVNHRAFLFGRGELPYGGLLVIDPYNGVKMRHGNAF